MRMFKKDQGFTLVELMVVVLIIGILVAIAIPVFNSASESARNRTCQANQRTIDGAVQQYLASNTGITQDAVDDISVLFPDYIKAAPSCPSDATAAYVVTDGSVTGCPSTEDEVHDNYTD